MFLKFLICSTLMCLAVADVKHLSRTYLPSSPAVTNEKSHVALKIVYDVPDVSKNDIVDNGVKLNSLESFSKENSKDPAYGNSPFGFNGFPGGFPGAFPGQGFPVQGFPGQGFPGQAFPGQGFPGPVFPPQGFPGQGFPGSGFPPSQGSVNPAFPGQGFPLQGFPGQGFPQQGFPGQGFPGFPGPRYPPFQNIVYPGYSGQGYPNYPVYLEASEQLNLEENEKNKDDKLRLLVTNSDTQYDAANGGYLYNKPRVTF